MDYGEYVNPNESPVCGACIKITGPLGSVKATIQDMVRIDWNGDIMKSKLMMCCLIVSSMWTR